MLLDSWNDRLAGFAPSDRDIYFTEEYCRLYAVNGKRACCFCYEDNGRMMLFPVLLDAIPARKGKLDFETPYGYGGPIANTNDSDFWNQALRAIVAEMANMGVVCGFIRFHPFLGNAERSAAAIQVIKDRMTVAIDLEPEPSEIWASQVHPKNRNAIRKAVGAGLVFRADPEFTKLGEFLELYRATMKRLEADDFYLFEPDYYQKLAAGLGSHCFLGTVERAEKVLAAAIFFHEGPWGHYHLAGSDEEARALCANNLLVYEAALELRKRGAIRMHLGGGTDAAEENSLLAFKRKFSPIQQWFSIGKLVVDECEYKNLCAEWESRNPEKVTLYGRLLLRYRH